MTFSSFRLAVDLTSLFEDDRSWCYIYVDPQKFSVINDVETYLQNVFGILSPIKLYVGQYLLPSSETIKILCIGDVIRVVGSSDKCQVTEDHFHRVKKRKRSHPKKGSSSVQEDNPVKVSSHVDAAEGRAVSSDRENVCSQVVCEETVTGSQACGKQPAVPAIEVETGQTKLKQFTLRNNTATKVTEVPETVEEMKEYNPMLVGSISEMVTKDSDFSTVPENKLKMTAEPAPSDGGGDKRIDSGVLQKKRKRTRRHKRKMMLSSSVGEAVSLIRSSVETLPFLNSEKCYTSVSGNFSDSSKHIRFSHDGSDTSIAGESDFDTSNVKENVAKISFYRNMQSPRVRTVSNWDVKASPHSTPQTQNFANLLSLRLKAAPVVFERKQAKQKLLEPSTAPVGVQMSESCSAMDQLLNNSVCEPSNENVLLEPNVDPNNYPVLNGAPKQHDIILFKTLVLTENCIPQLSSYIMATVADFCPLTSNVTLHITSNGQELRQQPLKFASEIETDVGEDHFTTINWNEIHETRLLSRAT